MDAFATGMTGQAGDVRLELEDDLQGTLAHLGLVWRVRGGELGAARMRWFTTDGTT